MKMKSKKSELSFQGVIWIPRIIFIIVSIFAVVILVNTFISKKIDIADIEADLLYQRLIYSNYGLSYYDEEINRFYPGVIDINKFATGSIEKELENSIFYGEDNNYIGAKILLKDIKEENEYVIFYNKDFFNDKLEIYNANLKGVGAVTGVERNIPILINEGGEFRNGFLNLLVLIQNT